MGIFFLVWFYLNHILWILAKITFEFVKLRQPQKHADAVWTADDSFSYWKSIFTSSRDSSNVDPAFPFRLLSYTHVGVCSTWTQPNFILSLGLFFGSPTQRTPQAATWKWLTFFMLLFILVVRIDHYLLLFVGNVNFLLQMVRGHCETTMLVETYCSLHVAAVTNALW